MQRIVGPGAYDQHGKGNVNVGDGGVAFLLASAGTIPGGAPLVSAMQHLHYPCTLPSQSVNQSGNLDGHNESVQDANSWKLSLLLDEQDSVCRATAFVCCPMLAQGCSLTCHT